MNRLHIAMILSGVWLLGTVSCEQAAPPATSVVEGEESAPSPPIETGPNAAAEYRRLIAELGSGFMEPLANMDIKSPPNATEAAYLMKLQPKILDAIAASKIERFDSGIDDSQLDQHTLMPHLGDVRKLVVLLQYDAHRLIQVAGGQRGAAERLMAILRMGAQVGNEPVLLSKLVAFSCLSVGAQSAKEWSARFSQTELRALLVEHLSAARNSDTFDLKAAFRTERSTITRTIEGASGTVAVAFESVALTESEKPEIIKDIDRIFGMIDTSIGSVNAEAEIRKAVDSSRTRQARAMFGGFATVPKSSARVLGEIDGAIAALR